MLSKKKFGFILFSVVLISGCSSFIESTRKSLLSDDSPRKNSKKQAKWVSKSQYDDLMIKYKNLQMKYEALKEEKLTSRDAFNQIDKLAATGKKDMSSETVDLFNDDKSMKGISPIMPMKMGDANESTITKELKLYRKATSLYKIGKFPEALKIFQHLDKSSTRQVAVRAKKRVADIYFMKRQYDLALQVYEEIIRHNAFSGTVLNALSGAVKCAKSLGLENKRVKYESLLRDIFEENV